MMMTWVMTISCSLCPFTFLVLSFWLFTLAKIDCYDATELGSFRRGHSSFYTVSLANLRRMAISSIRSVPGGIPLADEPYGLPRSRSRVDTILSSLRPSSRPRNSTPRSLCDQLPTQGGPLRFSSSCGSSRTQETIYAHIQRGLLRPHTCGFPSRVFFI